MVKKGKWSVPGYRVGSVSYDQMFSWTLLMRVFAANRRSLATFLLCKWAIDWCRNAYSKEDRKMFGCKGDWSYQKQDVRWKEIL